MKKSSLTIFRLGALSIALVLMFFVPAPAGAATATASFPVTASVANLCTVTTTAANFGAYNTIGAATVNATGTLRITCTSGTAITNVTLGPGANGVTGTYGRTLISGANKIGYDLYVPASTAAAAACAYTTKWDTSVGVFVPVVAPSNVARLYNVCGRTTQGQNVLTGSYTDTVAVTVNY
jgi:spore coat protein U-like protein